MNYNSQSWLMYIQDCTLRAIRPCVGWLPCLQRQHQVHPETGGQVDSKFLELNSQRRIRIVHIENSKKVCNTRSVSKLSDVKYVCQSVGVEPPSEVSFSPENEFCSVKPRSHSIVSNSSEPSSDDYWFTRWSRPLRISDTGTCNCSFRKSWRKSLRDSKLSNHILSQTQEEIIHTNPNEEVDHAMLQDIVVDGAFPMKPQNSTMIENFVEVFIQEILHETIKNISQSQRMCLHSTSSSPNNLSTNLEDLRISEINHCTCSSKPNSKCCKESFIQDELVCQTKIFCSRSDDGYTVKETIGNTSSVNESQREQIASVVGMGCINPNFIGSVLEPDTLVSRTPNVKNFTCESFVSNTISKQNNLSASEKGSSSFKDLDALTINPQSLDLTNNCSQSPPQTFFNIDLSHREVLLESNGPICTSGMASGCVEKCLPSVNSNININDETNGKINLNNQKNNISVCISSNVEANQRQELQSSLPEAVNQNVNIRKKSTTCHHTASTKRLKPVLFFLHGVGCSADLWSSLLRYFVMHDYEVVAPDMLGHGYSSAPDHASAYVFHYLLKDALDIFDKLVGEHRKCVIIGHAYGCSLATAMARYRPQQVAQLVLISGGGPTPLAPLPPSLSPCLQACMKPLLMCGFRRDVLYAPCGKHIGSGDALSNGIPPYVLQHVAQGQDWPEGDSAFHRRILVPTLLVYGMRDPYVTLVQECEMERTIPRSFLELIPNAGHFAMLETPGKLSHMIHCFIDWWSR